MLSFSASFWRVLPASGLLLAGFLKASALTRFRSFRILSAEAYFPLSGYLWSIFPTFAVRLCSVQLPIFICTVASPGFLFWPHWVHSRAVCFVAESRSHGLCQLLSLPGRQPESQHSMETKAILEFHYPQENIHDLSIDRSQPSFCWSDFIRASILAVLLRVTVLPTHSC